MSERQEMNPSSRQPEAAGDKKQENLTLGQELYQTLQSMVWIVLVILFLFTFVVRITVVDGESMENTLCNGDVVLTWKLGYTPKQGDIVVLTKTSFREQSIIKRVIATEGQRVDIDYGTSTVCVDGVALKEDYIKDYMVDIYGGSGTNHVTVPEGCIFVMGDNRNNSWDSRHSAIGIVDVRCVIGQAVLVMFPISDFGML